MPQSSWVILLPLVRSEVKLLSSPSVQLLIHKPLPILSPNVLQISSSRLGSNYYKITSTFASVFVRPFVTIQSDCMMFLGNRLVIRSRKFSDWTENPFHTSNFWANMMWLNMFPDLIHLAWNVIFVSQLKTNIKNLRKRRGRTFNTAEAYRISVSDMLLESTLVHDIKPTAIWIVYLITNHHIEITRWLSMSQIICWNIIRQTNLWYIIRWLREVFVTPFVFMQPSM